MKQLSDKKLKRIAKINARVKLKLQKRLAPVASFIDRLEKLKQDIESVNPRMAPLQPHTKQKWLEDLQNLINEAKLIIVPVKKEKEVQKV